MATALEMDVAALETEEIKSLIDEVMLTLLENNVSENFPALSILIGTRQSHQYRDRQ
jgi:hypothetical protein